MPAVNPFFTFLSLVIQQTTRISTTFQKTDYSDALLADSQIDVLYSENIELDLSKMNNKDVNFACFPCIIAV
jgi:hypothetical protein